MFPDDTVTVIERVGTVERALSAPGVSEIALGLDDRGVTTFRPQTPLGTDGTFVRYEGGREVSAVRGRFAPPRVHAGDWVVAVDHELNRPVLLAYTLSQRATASLRPAIPLTTIAVGGRR